MINPEQKLIDLGFVLPAAPAPIANFLPYRISGKLLFLSGQGPLEASGQLHTGKVGDTVDAESAYAHARLTGINLLAVIRDALKSLDRVDCIMKVFGMVNAVPDFKDHPYVINGCSDLFTEIFGKARGCGARSAIGVGSLPGNQTVEIEAIAAIRD
jgi:enamine deaminase RidA (YjgF/YER057c/UK114 family)